MSVSTSALAKQLKELLGAGSNAEVLERVRELQARPAPRPEPVVVAVRWQPGMEEAGVIILSSVEQSLRLIAEALRRGESMVLAQMEEIAAQAQSEAARLRAELAKKEEG